MSTRGRRRFGCAEALACAAAALLARDAWSAEVRLRAPDDCADAGAITEQIDGLLGRALATVDGVDFDVQIAAAPDQKSAWSVRVCSDIPIRRP